MRRAWERVFDARATSEAEWYSLFVLLRRAAAFLLSRMGWNVLRNGAWNQPDQEKHCRGDVYWPPSIELTSKSVSGEATAKR